MKRGKTTKKPAAMNLFVVVLEDSLDNPKISVHRTRAGADARVKKHKESYSGYAWIMQTLGAPSVRGWLHYERADDDDGPGVRIQLVELES